MMMISICTIIIDRFADNCTVQKKIQQKSNLSKPFNLLLGKPSNLVTNHVLAQPSTLVLVHAMSLLAIIYGVLKCPA